MGAVDKIGIMNLPGPMRAAASNGSTAERVLLGLGWFSAWAPLAAGNEAQRTAMTQAESARVAGQMGQADLMNAERAAMGEMRAGQSAALSEYDRALSDAQQYQSGLGGYFAPEMQAGDAALHQLNQALLQGDTSGLATDPYYDFQRGQGELAIERAQAARGGWGGGAHIRELTNFNQQLAAQEFDASINRLMGLAGQGQAAYGNYASLNQQAANNMLGLYGAQSELMSRGGQNLAGLGQNFATAQANVLNQQATNQNGYNLQGASANAWGVAQANNAFQNAASTAGYFASRNQSNNNAAPARPTPTYYDAPVANSATSDSLYRTA